MLKVGHKVEIKGSSIFAGMQGEILEIDNGLPFPYKVVIAKTIINYFFAGELIILNRYENPCAELPVTELKKGCVCPSRELFHYGCKCGAWKAEKAS